MKNIYNTKYRKINKTKKKKKRRDFFYFSYFLRKRLFFIRFIPQYPKLTEITPLFCLLLVALYQRKNKTLISRTKLKP